MEKNTLLKKNPSYSGQPADRVVAAREPIAPEKLEFKRLIFPIFILVFLIFTIVIMLA